MSLDIELVDLQCEIVAEDETSGAVRVSVDLCAHAAQQGVAAVDAREKCSVVDVATGDAVPHRVFYTNDLAYDHEQVAWRAEPGGRYAIEFTRNDLPSPTPLAALGVGEPLLLGRGPLALGVCHPHVAIGDLDGDGRQDLVIGSSDQAGYVYFLRNVGEMEPAFAAAVRLRADGEVIKGSTGVRKIGATQPWVGDWDGDGLLDLLVLGATKGDQSASVIRFYRNVGCRECPVFTDGGLLLTDQGSPLVLSRGNAGYYNCFHPVDWTRNGTKDILAVIPAPGEGSHGRKVLVLYENVGTNVRPRFRSEPTPVLTRSGDEISSIGLIESFLPVDWHRPGYVDLLLSAYVHYGKVFVYENPASDAAEPPELLDSRALLADGGRPAPLPLLTDYPAPTLRLRDGEELHLPDQISSLQAVRWTPDAERELLVATVDGRVYRLRNTSRGGWRPVLDRPEHIESTQVPVDVGGFSVPACHDWDGDGKVELVVGNVAGDLEYFVNTGTAGAPEVVSRGKVRARGGLIRYPGCNRQILENGGGYSSPVAVDLDRDGLTDLVVSESRGYLNFHRNTGTPQEPAFEEGRKLRLDSDVFQGPWRVMPAFLHNPDEDFTRMIAKEHDGTLCTYRNSAGDILTFGRMGPLSVENGQTVSDGMYGRSRICLVDWRGDGVFSLVLGTHGHRLEVSNDGYRIEGVSGGGHGAGLILFENVGSSREPLFRLPRDVRFGGRVLRKGMGHAVNPAFTSWFGETGNDMVLGAENGVLYVFRRSVLS